MRDLKPIARQIFREALASVDVQAATRREITCTGDALSIANTTVLLSDIDRLILIAIGKAAAPMHEAARAAIAPANLHVESIVVAPGETISTEAQYDHALFFAGAHPLPDERSAAAARAVLHLLRTSNDRTAVLFLISGGASAMMELPIHSDLSMAHMQDLHRCLVGSGMPIAQMNTVRKHLSAVKGGRLAVAAQAACQQWSLLVSDVPHAAPDVIASGPSLPDTSSAEEAASLLCFAQQGRAWPASLAALIHAGRLEETPKPTHPAFVNSSHKVMLSSEHLAAAAARAASSRGFHTVIDNTCDDWDFHRAGDYLLARAEGLAEQGNAFCLISVGEISVQLPPTAGVGGRNQHLALWLAKELARRNLTFTALSAGSDGIDGNSRAAGAAVDAHTISEASAIHCDADAHLQRFDSSSLFVQTGQAIVTGPTGNNLRDLRMFLWEPSGSRTT